MKKRIIIGIDPGVKTGFAIWIPCEQKFSGIETFGIVKVLSLIENSLASFEIEIRFEDARKRKWFGDSGREKLQGAGSIKRDSSIWQEFCEYHNVPYEAIKPAAGSTKWDSEYFKKVTGWTKRTSSHARDAALLVFGIK